MDISSLFVQYGYANIMLCAAFAISIGLLSLSRIAPRFFSCSQLLKINYALVASVICLPFMGKVFPHESFFEPTAQIWSAPSMSHEIVRAGASAASSMVPMSFMNNPAMLPLDIVKGSVAIVVALGIVIYSLRLLIDIVKIKRIMAKARFVEGVEGVRVLASSQITVPFSFWAPRRSTIVVPCSFLESQELFEIAVFHERQHHRQGDTRWIYALQLLKIFFFWNPVVHLWARKITEIQEFACDEALVDRKDVSPRAYCGCLVRAAELAMKTHHIPVCATGMAVSISGRVFKRRMSIMLRHGGRRTKWPLVSLLCGVIAVGIMITAAYASHGLVQDRRITMENAEELANNAIGDEDFSIVINDRVLAQLNRYLGTPDGRKYMRDALQRMEQYRSIIEKKLAEYNVPDELMAVPLMESGYKNLPPEVNRVQAAGLWQFIAKTARNYGLRVDDTIDERLDVELETDAAMRLLLANKLRFKDWGLSLLAYNAGERLVQKGVKETGSRDVWALLDAGYENNRDYISKVIASIIIMKNPAVLE